MADSAGQTNRVITGLKPLVLLVGVAAAIAAGVGIMLWSIGPTFSLLYSNLAGEDAAQITQALDSARIPYKLDDGGGSISVPSEQIAAIQVGGTVTFQVRGYPNERFQGRIERVSPTADSSTRQVPIFVTIPNKQRRLVAGLFAEGRIERQSKTGLVVPQTAVNENGSAPWVLKVQDGKAQRVDVTVGLRDEQTERLEITRGVAAGDLLLVGAAQGMTPGTPLRVRAQTTSSN